MTLSAGLLMYRGRGSALEVLIVHPGGPFFARRDAGWWSIPKGLVEADEAELGAARREFEEETAFLAEVETFLPLGEVVQKSGKKVHAWAFVGDCDPAAVRSNTFELEWPPNSGRMQSFPEIDRAAWFSIAEARRMILPAQAPFLERLLEHLASRSG